MSRTQLTYALRRHFEIECGHGTCWREAAKRQPMEVLQFLYAMCTGRLKVWS